MACVGEGIERLLARALPCDSSIEAAWASWPLGEPAVDPRQWVLFHQEQYDSEGFPFAPLTPETVCRWLCCREAMSGAPQWVPEELVYLTSRPGECQNHSFGFSTGLSCGKIKDAMMLRGVQEVIERDALMGAWWGRYDVEEWPIETVRESLGPALWHRVDRPNLQYRGYRIRSPFSDHVTLISVSGVDEEGWVFSVGSACREARHASWRKSLLEAIQGRHCVRLLLSERNGSKNQSPTPIVLPTTFFEHALFYTLHPEKLSATVLERADPPTTDPIMDEPEGLATLQSKLSNRRPILFRNLTPPQLAVQFPDWLVLRVVIPGLQPLHGDHRLPFLGGPLWEPRSYHAWESTPPHPFA
jgi:ribosomal protein S12 methylthiotransferase accessory factor